MSTSLRTLFQRWFRRHRARETPESTLQIVPDSEAVIHIDESYPAHLAPYDENLLERARTQWQFGDWASLMKLEHAVLQDHPERAKLALLAAAGHMQQGDAQSARKFTRLAQQWGCNKKLVSQILIAGVHNSLGRAASLAGEKALAIKHFESAIAIGTPGSELRLIAQARAGEQLAQLGISGNSAIVENRPAALAMEKSRAIAQAGEKRIVIVAGLNRSGSTWLYNCVRLLLGLKYPDVYAGWVKDYDPKNSSPIHLIKLHEPDDALCSLTEEIYTSRRDIRDIAGSMVRMGWLKKEEIWKNLDWIVHEVHPFWAKHTRFEIEYSEILTQPRSLIENIGHSLGVHVDVVQANAIGKALDEMEPGESYDKATQLHPNHRADAPVDYRNALGNEISQGITERYQEWLLRYGYIPPN